VVRKYIEQVKADLQQSGSVASSEKERLLAENEVAFQNWLDSCEVTKNLLKTHTFAGAAYQPIYEDANTIFYRKTAR
jgi:hypothetical protein